MLGFPFSGLIYFSQGGRGGLFRDSFYCNFWALVGAEIDPNWALVLGEARIKIRNS